MSQIQDKSRPGSYQRKSLDFPSSSNSFYKLPNSSRSSTDLVATKRFSNILLEKTGHESPQIQSQSPIKKPSSVLSRISMFENSESVQPRSFRSFKDSQKSPLESYTFKTRMKSSKESRFKRSPEMKFDEKSKENEKENVSDVPKASISAARASMLAKREANIEQKKTEMPTQDQFQDDTMTSTSSILKAPQIHAARVPVTTAFVHDPIYRRTAKPPVIQPRFHKMDIDKPLRRSASAATSVMSERPIVDFSKSYNLSSSASITGSLAGSIMSEKPLYDLDINSEDEASSKQLKSSNSILSDSIFEDETSGYPHQITMETTIQSPNQSQIQPQIQRQTHTQTFVAPSAKLFAPFVSPVLSHSDSFAESVSNAPSRKHSMDLLSEFSYLFKLQEEPDKRKSVVVSSSSFRSNLDESAASLGDAIIGDVSKITKASNTVRFNEEITEYDHPGDDEASVESEIELITNGKQPIYSKEESEKFFSGSSTSLGSKKPKISPRIVSREVLEAQIQRDFGTLEGTRTRRKIGSLPMYSQKKLAPSARHSMDSYTISRIEPPIMEDSSSSPFLRRLSTRSKRASLEPNDELFAEFGTAKSRNSRPLSVQSSRTSYVSAASSNRRFSRLFQSSSKRNSLDSLAESRRNRQSLYSVKSGDRSRRSLVSFTRSKSRGSKTNVDVENALNITKSKEHSTGSVFNSLLSKLISFF